MNTGKPTKALTIADGIELALLADRHAPHLLSLVNENRTKLRRWLPWVDAMQSTTDFTGYIRRCHKQLAAGTDVGYVIQANGRVAGRIGLHFMNEQSKTGAIGYWIGEEFSGRGIVTKACQGVVEIGFTEWNLNRIEIKCATGNGKSAAVAERLGFTKEGVLRQAEWVNGQPHDLYLYSMLGAEWKEKSKNAWR